MKKQIINPRVIEYFFGILATGAIALGLFLYAWDEPTRIALAQQDQLYADLDGAMTLYAENCSVCHGAAGEGIGSTPAIDNPALRETDYDILAKIIERGLFNTAMPAWSQRDGGPLNDYQIGELVTLVQYGDWEQAQERVVNLGLAPRIPFTVEPDAALLEQVATLPDGNTLVRGLQLYSQECVACHGADGLGTTLAPALNDVAVREKSQDELARIILNGVSGTLMAPWENTLSEDDLNALITLIVQWERVPAGSVPAPERPILVTEESLALGSTLYTNSCAHCHGPEGQGTQRAPALNVKGFLTDTNDAAIEQIITLGVPGTAMPAWGDRMSEAEIQALVGLIRSWEPNAPEVAEPARGGGPWWQAGGTTTPGGGKGGGPAWMQNGTGGGGRGRNALPSGGTNQDTVTQSDQLNKAQGTGTAALGGGAKQGSGTQGEQTGQGPPWGQQQAATGWWEQIDWLAVGMIGLSLSIPLILVGLAVTKLRQLASVP
ncbi:MAG: c-type cytochrome [Chloroflexota bacterium]